MNSRKIFRNSSVIAIPQQYVTVQIHNTSNKKKLRNHRESIINQMKNTQVLLEQTLNKNLRHPKSKFTPNLKIQTPTSQTVRGFRSQDSSVNKDTYLTNNSDITRKLRQLCNISQHFQKACQYKKKIIPTHQSSNEGTYSLPLPTPSSTPPILEQRAKQQMKQHKNMIRDWKVKLKLGRQFINTVKLKSPLKYKDMNYKNRIDQQQTQTKRYPPRLKSLRDIYFSQIRPQRKTAPLPNNIQLLFTQQKKSRIGYIGSVQRQPALKIQKFIQGGQQRQFNEYSNYFNINQFKRSKQKYNILNKIYNYIKQNNIYQFKDMSIEHFQDKNLLSIVYYIENNNNMTEIDKKNFRKKLQIID